MASWSRRRTAKQLVVMGARDEDYRTREDLVNGKHLPSDCRTTRDSNHDNRVIFRKTFLQDHAWLGKDGGALVPRACRYCPRRREKLIRSMNELLSSLLS